MAIGYENTNDPRKLAQNQRGLVQQQGDRLNQEFQDQGDQASQATSGYQSFLDPIEQQMASGQGGYNPDEAAGIQDQGGLDQISGELSDNYLTPEERSGMMGDTSSYTDYFNPNGMNQELDSQHQNASDIAQGMSRNLSGAIDPNALSQSEGYRAQVQGGLNQFGKARSALYDGEAQNVRGAIDPTALRQSSEAAKAETMSPEDRQAMITAAGISAGTQNQAAVGALERQSRAAGSSPLGVAAYRGRMNQASSIEAADAMTKARAATQAQSAAEAQQAEQQRIGAQQYLTGTQVGAEETMGEQAVNLENQIGQQQLAQANTQEQNRQQAQQYLTGANLQAETTGGEAQLQNAQTSAAQSMQQNQYNTSTGTNVRQAQDAANANRSAGVAQNRQATNVNNQGTQLNVSNAGSGRATTVANTRLNQQNTGLGLQQGQQQMYNANAQGAYGRQEQNYSTQTQGTNEAAATALKASQTPSTLDKAMGGVSGAIGAAAKFLEDGDTATEPTLAVVGERGPEEIVPVGKPYVGSPYRARAPQPVAAAPKKQGRKIYGEAA